MSMRTWLIVTSALVLLALALWALAAETEGATALLLRILSAIVILAWVAFYVYDLRRDVREARSKGGDGAQHEQPRQRGRRRR
jgi:ABC-type Co2+ transport system permease subunit